MKTPSKKEFTAIIIGILIAKDDMILLTREQIDEQDTYVDDFCEYNIYADSKTKYYIPQTTIIPYTSDFITLCKEQPIDEEQSPITYVILNDEQICSIDMQDLTSMKETIENEIIPILTLD